ncbi:MAG: glycosyltransferase family 4 protein [Isosphaeraceae bacterium]
MSQTFAISFTNFGPYHLARLRALAVVLEKSGTQLIAYETAGNQGLYPWKTSRDQEPFEWVTLFPDRTLEDLTSFSCKQAMRGALDRDRPDALGIVGYVRPESNAMLSWARENGKSTVLMSETQKIDHPRTWWKEAIKRRRVRRFSAALVGGPRHRDYLESLGIPASRIALGYNAVDSASLASQAETHRENQEARQGLPSAPYFLAVSRFAREKNLISLIRAYTRYRQDAAEQSTWDLVLCGDGPAASEIEAAIVSSGFQESIHRPGFLQLNELTRWYAYASAFVHPSLMEPWGLVVNEAAACGLPLLISDRSGCVETFVPDGTASTGRRLNARDINEMAMALKWISGLPVDERRAMGERAGLIARDWGPERFAQGAVEAFQTALLVDRLRRRARQGPALIR